MKTRKSYTIKSIIRGHTSGRSMDIVEIRKEILFTSAMINAAKHYYTFYYSYSNYSIIQAILKTVKLTARSFGR